jgi:hypothetical protein
MKTDTGKVRNLIHVLLVALTAIGLLVPVGVAQADDNPSQRIVKGLEITVDRGCGATYFVGDHIEIQVSVPEEGWLTVWQSVNGENYQLSKPEWVTPNHNFTFSGAVQPPVGNETVTAYFDGKSGHSYEDSCNYQTKQHQQQSQLKCEVYMPDQVHSGEKFEIEVKVWNTGNHRVRNVKLFGKATPKGYFQIHSCEPNCNGTTTWLGQIRAGKSRWASYWVTAPQNKAGDFDFEFYAEAQGGAKAYCGLHELSVLGGQFIVPQK